MSEEQQQLFEATLARVETRLIRVVNERTTHVIDATKAVIGGLHEEIQINTTALNEMSARLARVEGSFGDRIVAVERQIAALVDLVPGAAIAPGEPTLSERVEEVEAEQKEQSATNEQLWTVIVILGSCVVGIVAALLVGWMW